MPQRYDALTPGANAYFNRKLRYVHPTVLEEQRPPKSFMSLFPISRDVPATALTYEKALMEALGEAKIGTGLETNTNAVSLGLSSEIGNVRLLLLSYGWSVFELERCAEAGVPLPTKYARATRDLIEQKHNDIFFDGAEAWGLRGLLTHPLIPRVTMSEPISSSASSVAALIADLKGFMRSSFLLTKTRFQPTYLGVPPTQYGYLADTYRSTTSDLTILDALKKGAASATAEAEPKNLIVVPIHELEGAGPNDEDLIMAWTPDKMVARGEIPGGRVFANLAPQASKYRIDVHCYGVNGGFTCDYPLMIAVGVLP